MPMEANGGFWGRSGPTGWATRWVFGTALGQVVFTGTTRLVMAVLMGAAVGGLAVWLVLRRRSTRPGYDNTATAGSSGRAGRRVRRHHGSIPNPAYRLSQPHPGAVRGRSMFSPRARSAPLRTQPVRSAPDPTRRPTTGPVTGSGTGTTVAGGRAPRAGRTRVPDVTSTPGSGDRRG
ncbi:hypothetical protein [Plantactinospora sonchi]|uniref:Uncharacterized protein n=1 Tax=Plantactinospora sonchi TaxID=1544735 RepID=A0ABU7S0V3_9ACTN